MPAMSVLRKAPSPIDTSEVASERSRPVSLVVAKAWTPIDTSEAASDRSRPVSLVPKKAYSPIVLTAAPSLSVPVRSVLDSRKLTGMSVKSGSASSQHGSAPLGATAHFFNPGIVTSGGGGLGDGGGGLGDGGGGLG
eukprot:scaffold56200_cov66-Phaeocystis_antarctica.AAC.1